MTKQLSKVTSQSSPQSTSPATKYLWSVALTSALTAFHFGYAIASINVPSTIFFNCSSSSSNSHLISGCFHVSKEAWGFVGMGLPLGGWIGGFSAPSLITRAGGIKPAIQFLNAILIISYLIMSFAINLPMLVIGRLLFGFVSGASCMLIPLYLSSISPFPHRGFFTNFFQLFLCGGIVVAEFVSLVSGVGKTEWTWRFTFGAGLLIVALQVILDIFFGFLPQSPRDLDPQAVILLNKRLGIQAESSDFKDSDADSFSSASSASAVPELNQTSFTLWDLITFKIPVANASLLLGILLHAGQQISGVNAIFFYSSMIIQGSDSTPLILALINFGMTFVAVWLLERAGRRPVALFSVAGSAICLLAIAATFSSHKTAAAIFLISFVACFSVGLGPIPWMIVPEIFPPSWPLTPAASAICVSANWITNILVTGTFPSLIKILPESLIFLAFGISCSLLLFALISLLPETKNRPSNFI